MRGQDLSIKWGKDTLVVREGMLVLFEINVPLYRTYLGGSEVHRIQDSGTQDRSHDET